MSIASQRKGTLNKREAPKAGTVVWLIDNYHLSQGKMNLVPCQDERHLLTLYIRNLRKCTSFWSGRHFSPSDPSSQTQPYLFFWPGHVKLEGNQSGKSYFHRDDPFIWGHHYHRPPHSVLFNLVLASHHRMAKLGHWILLLHLEGPLSWQPSVPSLPALVAQSLV